MTQNSSNRRSWLIFGLCLAGILGVLFFPCFKPGVVFFSNDGPLGAVHAAAAGQPSGFLGLWYDLNSIGYNGGAFFVSFTPTLLWLLQPLLFAKFYGACSLAILGCCAWIGLRLLKLSPLACLLGALAVMLNSTYFSIACWGVGPQNITAGMSFLAIGLVAGSNNSWRGWAKLILAGMAVGMGVMEGFDVGVIYSLVVAAFVLFYALAGEGLLAKRAAAGIGKLAVISLCAGFLATQAVTLLVKTQIQGIAGTEQDSRTKLEHWDWATQWSLPKREALSLVIPGLFGYRMDTPDGGNYWGAAGRDPSWDRYFAGGKQGPPPDRFIRYTGGGSYAGILVILIAVWAGTQALRKQGSPFNLEERRFLWFWIAALVISLLLAFGRHAPFYQFLYALPYFSTIRNPAKFLHIVTLALLFLFAFGVDRLSRRFLEPLTSNGQSRTGRLKVALASTGTFDKRWIIGSAVAVVLSLIGWLIYASSSGSLQQYLQGVQFDETTARALAEFSVKQVGWFILFLVLSVALFIGILTGRFTGKRAKFAGVLLGLLLVVDLGRANLPWLIFWNWEQKYATNSIIEQLRDKPYEHRVAILPFQPPGQLRLLNDLYRVEWAQHHFQYYNVQSLDIVQMSRVPANLEAFERALQFDGSSNTMHRVTRRWQLVNNSYLLGAAGFLDVLNKQIDPEQHRFRIATAFDIVAKPGIQNPTRLEELTAVTKPDGQYALFEFTGALPRAKLFTNWQVSTNDQAALAQLASAGFDLEKTLLVDDRIEGVTGTRTNEVAGTVKFVSYAPKRILLQAKANAPSVLLLNDKFDADWKVTVDGKQNRLLRCNYLMRGVQVPSGEHRIEFRFEPPITGLYVSLAAIVLGLGLIGFLALSKEEGPVAPRPASPELKAKETARA